MEEIQNRITGVVGVENVAHDTDLVIEAVFGYREKCGIQCIDAACVETILASTPLH